MSGYTRQEVAQRAGVDPDYLDRLVQLGVLTPAAADGFSPGDALRARWLQSLERAGVPLEGLAAAIRTARCRSPSRMWAPTTGSPGSVARPSRT